MVVNMRRMHNSMRRCFASSAMTACHTPQLANPSGRRLSKWRHLHSRELWVLQKSGKPEYFHTFDVKFNQNSSRSPNDSAGWLDGTSLCGKCQTACQSAVPDCQQYESACRAAGRQYRGLKGLASVRSPGHSFGPTVRCVRQSTELKQVSQQVRESGWIGG